MTEMGEFLVGAWLKEIKNCDFVQYNARLPEAGLPGLNEVDVIGLDLKNKIAYVCEVTTHVRGAQYGTYQETIEKIRRKFDRDMIFADKMLKDFPSRKYMFWSPVVPEGMLTAQLKDFEDTGVEVVINEEYAERVEELKKAAHERENNSGNPAFRLLQILAHVRKPRVLPATALSPKSDHGEGHFPTYQKGSSCIQLGKPHQFVRRVSGTGSTYLHCSECGSSQTL